jgi:hypothetical protein
MAYELHPSERLRAQFREKPWQGADPSKALFLFVGLDANYDANIEKTLPEVFEYLGDGVSFWRKYGEGVHHPFRLPHYHGSGKRYHDRFADIGFTSEHAPLVSFIELLHLPTTGRSVLALSDLSPDHLDFLAGVFNNGLSRYVFMPSGVARLMRQAKRFPWLPTEPLKTIGDLPVLYKKNGCTVYEVYHFSCYGWQLPLLKRQIARIGDIVRGTQESG